MLKVYQIYYKEEQLPLDYIPYYNQETTPFFENSVIRSLIEADQHKGCEYFGVVSWKLRDKIAISKNSWRNIPNIANKSINQFTPVSFEFELMKYKPDAMSMQRHMPHDPVSYADIFHPNFSKYFKEIMSKIGYNWEPTRFNDIFYCNYMIAKSEIYEKYVKEMLIPAMDIMENMPELMGDSGYPEPLREELKSKWGINHYPYHAFIAERFFSYFAHIHQLKCMHY